MGNALIHFLPECDRSDRPLAEPHLRPGGRLLLVEASEWAEDAQTVNSEEGEPVDIGGGGEGQNEGDGGKHQELNKIVFLKKD